LSVPLIVLSIISGASASAPWSVVTPDLVAEGSAKRAQMIPLLSIAIDEPSKFLHRIPNDLAIAGILPYLNLADMKNLKQLSSNVYGSVKRWEMYLTNFKARLIRDGVDRISEIDVIVGTNYKLYPFAFRLSDEVAEASSAEPYVQIKAALINARGVNYSLLCCWHSVSVQASINSNNLLIEMTEELLTRDEDGRWIPEETEHTKEIVLYRIKQVELAKELIYVKLLGF
jgi:hypothetical protein